MVSRYRCAKINVKVLVIVILVTVAVGVSLFAARQVRRKILSRMDLEAGTAAYEEQDWQTAYKHFQEYLGRNPHDVEILKKYAKAGLSIRPLDAAHVGGAIGAYRRVMQLAPRDEDAYEQLTTLYAGTGGFEELAYIARRRLEQDPNDREAPLLLADALVRLNKSQEAQQTLAEFIGQLDEALPDKYAEYVGACVGMSRIAASDSSPGAQAKALELLNQAVDYMPESVEALANRAQFYRVTPGISSLSDEQRMARARKDLEEADSLGTDDPRIRLLLGAEWMAHGELDRATAELQAAEDLPQEALEKHFFDIHDWDSARFAFALDLAARRGSATEGAALADEALAALTEQRHRVRVLPFAIPLYVAAGKAVKARDCLNEYLGALRMQQGTAQPRFQLAYVQALVAMAEERPHAVIDALQPAVVTDASRPEMWRLLAEAYSRTGQTRRAVRALTEYVRLRPRDPGASLRLAQEYFRLRDWNRAVEAARLAEPIDPTEITARLLRIEASSHLAAAEQDQGTEAARLDELSAELAQLRKKHPDRVDIRILQAVLAVYLEQPDEAERELKLAIEQCKDPLRAEMQLAGHYFRTRRMSEALRVCQAACERHSEIAEPWLALSDLHVANADYDSARGCLRQGLDAVSEKGEKRSVLMRLALLELTHGNRTTGIDVLSEMAAQDEQEVRARSLLLGIPEIRQDPAAAEKLIKELQTAEGESGLFWRLHEASLLLSSDEWRSKQQDITGRLQYCIDADPRWSAPVLLLAGMYEKLGDVGRVEDTLRQALVRNPSASDMADRLLTLLERQGRFSDAEKVFQQVKADPRITRAWQVRMALGAGDISGAIDDLKLRVSSDDQDANSRIQLARLVYLQTKDIDQAFVYLKQAKAITPKSIALTVAEVSILRAEGRADEARRVLDDYVADTNDSDAYWMRAVYFTEQGELERAEEDYRKLMTFAERGAAGYELLSDFCARNKKLDEAVVTLEQGLNAYPTDLRLKRRLMNTLFLRGHAQDRQRALEILTELDERLPQDPGLMKLRAMLMLEEPTPQSVKTARETLENVVKLQPMAVDAHLTLIRIAMQEGRYEGARDHAVRALGSNPNSSALLSARAGAELALGNTQMAVELAHLVVQRDPNDAVMTLGAASILSRSDSHKKEAVELIHRVFQRDPNNAEIILRAASILSALENHEREAVDLVHLVIQKDPNNAEIILRAASILSALDSMNHKEEGVKLFEQAIALSPTSTDARFGLASSLYQTGNAERARKIYEELLQQNPQDTRILNDLAWILQEHFHQSADALTFANRGLSVAPDDLHLLDTRGTILSNMADRLIDAKKDFERLVSLSPPDTPRKAKALLQLGRICARLNDFDQAREHLEKALEIDQELDVFTPDERAEIKRMIQLK